MISEEVLKGMFQPRTTPWRTSITKVEPNRLVTQGYPQEELIGNISFPEMIHLLIKGVLPTKNQEKMLQAILVSFCDHGVTPPSTQSARLMASAGSPVNACLAGGILAFGENHAGAIEVAMKMLQKGIILSKNNGLSLDETAQVLFDYFTTNRRKIPGFGHRYHNQDPRAPRLIELSKEYDCFKEHAELAMEIQELLRDKKGINMNIDGANAALLSDMGFNWRVGCGLFIVGRVPGLLAHVQEEKTQEEPFRKLLNVDEMSPGNDIINSF
ncbi:MAG TPA: citryl-CoA lyase [Methanobacterium subterraneum]|uniref:Citryl-CoA lyase n=1 Tax=Methanobacterium subterraneum TaxID=59277 RepID=A0A7J4TLA9_9EURY|nr:citryl-CoA lyase [Methanobacterium subterraneum]